MNNGNYYAALGMEVARNNGSDYSRAASSSLDSASKTLGQVFDDTQDAFKQGKEDISAINDLLGSRGKINKDGSISGASGLYAIFDEVDRQNDLQARNLAEQIAKDKQENLFAEERMKLADSIKGHLVDTEYKNNTGYNKEDFNAIVNTAIEQKISKIPNEKYIGDEQQITLTNEAIKVYLTNPVKFQHDLRMLTPYQLEVINSIRNDKQLYNAIIQEKQLNDSQSLIDSGVFTPEMIRDISNEVDEYYGNRDSRTQTRQDIFDSYLNKNRIVGGMKQGETLDEYILRVQNAKSELFKQLYTGNPTFNPEKSSINRDSNSNSSNKTSSNKTANNTKSTTKNIEIDTGKLDFNSTLINDLMDNDEEFVSLKDKAQKILDEHDNKIQETTPAELPKNGDIFLVDKPNLIPLDEIKNGKVDLDNNLKQIKPEYRQYYKEYIGLKGQEDKNRKILDGYIEKNALKDTSDYSSMSEKENKANRDLERMSELEKYFNINQGTLVKTKENDFIQQSKDDTNRKLIEANNEYNIAKKERDEFEKSLPKDSSKITKEQYNRIDELQQIVVDAENKVKEISNGRAKDSYAEAVVVAYPAGRNIDAKSEIIDKDTKELANDTAIQVIGALLGSNNVNLNGATYKTNLDYFKSPEQALLLNIYGGQMKTADIYTNRALLDIMKDEKVIKQAQKVMNKRNEMVIPLLKKYDSGKITYQEFNNELMELSQNSGFIFDSYFDEVNDLISMVNEKLGETGITLASVDGSKMIGNLNNSNLNQEFINKDIQITILKRRNKLNENNLLDILRYKAR